MTCGRYDCDNQAAFVILQPYDRPLFRCAGHAEETYKVHSAFVNRQTTGARLVRL